MKIEFSVNIGTVKVGKHEYMTYHEEDKKRLLELEKSPLEFYRLLKDKKLKNVYPKETTFRDKVDLNTIFKRGIKEAKVTKSQRGCFITYTFEFN